MEWLSFDEVNWLAVALAFVVSFVLGWFWYSPAAFFPVWSRLGGLTEEKLKDANMGVAFGGTVVANLLGVLVLAMLMTPLGATGIGGGALLGAVLGLVYRAGAHALHNGFAARDPRITLIDGAHDVVALALAGAVLGIWM
ncbi:MAG: DUF1761 domain-containing protein [Actinobacteria bacterium HGW-Actinobacteria-4]|nr:MAG: DUF1761 domain-containing protein [Actinobacteria bacterium HGW-Actinobacteria-4]